MSESIAGMSVRTGIIIQMPSVGVDSVLRSKFGIAIDQDLITMVEDRSFLRLDARHYQIVTLLGVEKSVDGFANRWIAYLKQAREEATNRQLNLAYKSIDEDCDVEWTCQIMKRGDLFHKVSKIVTGEVAATSKTAAMKISMLSESVPRLR